MKNPINHINQLLKSVTWYCDKFNDTLQYSKDGHSLNVFCRGLDFLKIDKRLNKFIINGVLCEHSRIFDLKKEENCCVVMLLLELANKGYSKESIVLEKKFGAGRKYSYLDVYLKDNVSNVVYMIEAKSIKEMVSTVNPSSNKSAQLFNYAHEEKKTKIASYYTFDFKHNKHEYKYVDMEDLLKEASSKKDLINKWDKKYRTDNFIMDNEIFSIKIKGMKNQNLKNITEEDRHALFEGFTEILRINAVSDKSNAFNKIINLFLCKITDEIAEDTKFTITDRNNCIHTINGVKFQHINNVDTNESLLVRLNDLYKIGAKRFLRKDIIDYTEREIDNITKNSGGSNEIKKIFMDLRIKKSNEFTFIEVYDEASFENNSNIVREVVTLFQEYKFRYNYKHQYLGDFFEELLNTSLKQDEGQFFTPYPLVDFIVNSLQISTLIDERLKSRDTNFIPSIIDYACGSGHFINSYINKTQEIIDGGNLTPQTKGQKEKIEQYKMSKFSWINIDNIIGIEKDYRLAKTSKIATFLNGDGDAGIVNTDGINKFDCKDYQENRITENSFDLLLSNPPYSVKGFVKNLQNYGITQKDFTLYDNVNFTDKDTCIEVLFIERAHQLIKDNGMAVILLPQSILTGDSKYLHARKFILNNFKIRVMLMLADMTFVGTTTSPVVLFLQKKNVKKYNYRIMTIFSEKYSRIHNVKPDEERKFLGYKFSANKNVATTKTIDNSILSSFVESTGKFLYSDNTSSKNKLIKYPLLRDIIINDEKLQIYPKYYNVPNSIPLGKYFDINPNHKLSEDADIKYIEISNIKNNKINHSNKKKTSSRICKSGDILLASLTPTPAKIAVVDDEYYVSTAIFVLSIKKEYSDYLMPLYEELKKDYVIKQMNSLLDGFKVTYAKIKDDNLSKYVKIKKNCIKGLC